MSGFDWENLGEEISEIVEKAVQNQNFKKLNQSISNRFHQIVNGPEKLPVKVPSKAGAICSMVLGYPLGIGAFAFFAGYIVALFIVGSDGMLAVICAVSALLFGGFTALGAWLAVRGTKTIARINRLKCYMEVIGKREYCNIAELSEMIGKKSAVVLKDVEFMIKKRWFLQGHLDEQKTCLMLTDRMYQQYCQLEQQKAVVREETKRKEERKAQQAKVQEMEESRDGLSLEVQKVLAQGEEYVRKIRACNDAIPGEVISAKIDRIELLVDKIFDQVEKNPKCVSDIRKLMEYYLPTTVKLLEAYAQMDAQPAGGENIQNAKVEIEATLDTLNVAFEKLLDGLFQETAWDVSSDISVLNTMLAQEGLKEDGLKNKMN